MKFNNQTSNLRVKTAFAVCQTVTRSLGYQNEKYCLLHIIGKFRTDDGEEYGKTIQLPASSYAEATWALFEKTLVESFGKNLFDVSMTVYIDGGVCFDADILNSNAVLCVD